MDVILHIQITKRCGWGIDVENLLGGGCKFIL